ncbi:glycoside hydrolase family 32 protein [Amphibacillus cookii]|uniref:glycoside hydrolase family 32 protein n=1 Tax=Amphibacillus cookii TaxID=767787 RepID=UPI00195BC1AF|nr:sucrose-6-phosphate hydrolase [Amphibacillus cookii]MBM7540140.1 beta-fructofuranosidase [Amphibacillus cookii]
MNLLTHELQAGIVAKQPELREKVLADPWRLAFHEMPPTGWMNDPNGVCQYNGLYHLYYQYSPLDPEGGLKYWGHKTSTDLVHFNEEEIAIYPDQSFDLHGVYSGSAFVKDDQMHFYYTGNVKYEGDYDYIHQGREQNTVHAVSKDGFHYDYREVIIHANDYPEGFTKHIRDPKIVEKDNHYYMVLGGRTTDDQGAILVYQSEDLYNWSYHGMLLGGIDKMGYMWECPDFFELDGHDLLLMSPQGLQAQGYQYCNVYQSGYYLGETNWEQVEFSPTSPFIELDHGFDFYAPQTFEDEKGRRILWGWMGLPDIEPNYCNPTIERGWQHAMTLPRQLTVENGQLYQRPLPEYETIRADRFYSHFTISGDHQDDQLHGEVYEMIVTIEEIGDSLALHLRQDTIINYNKKDQLLTLSLGASGYGRDSRSLALASLEQLHIFSDHSSLEVFINDGAHVFTTRLYPQPIQDQIRFVGDASVSVEKWQLNQT